MLKGSLEEPLRKNCKGTLKGDFKGDLIMEPYNAL